MKRLTLILTVVLLCFLFDTIRQEKSDSILERSKRIKSDFDSEQTESERDSEGIDAISKKIPESKDLITLLEQELNLTDIGLYNIDGQEAKLGFAYRFGNRTKEKHYSYLIYAQNVDDLESFKHYEQFVDCGKSEEIDKNWLFPE